MVTQYNKEYFLTHRGCYSAEKMAGLCDNNPHSNIQEFLNWDISIKDKFYFVRNYTELTIKQKQLFALMCAKVSLEIYENKYPNDKRVRECIEATEQFLDGKITKEDLLIKRNAAADADAAAYAAAYAAAADAAAAYAAADAAVYAAAYAADADAAVYAAAYAADAAAYAADAATYAPKYINNLLNALKEFCKVHKN